MVVDEATIGHRQVRAAAQRVSENAKADANRWLARGWRVPPSEAATWRNPRNPEVRVTTRHRRVPSLDPAQGLPGKADN